MNKRFKTYSDTITTERIAHQIVISYDPTSENSAAAFYGREYLKLDDKYHPFGEGQEVINIIVSDILQDTVETDILDPITGTRLDSLSIAGLSILLKLLYDKFYNQHGRGQDE